LIPSQPPRKHGVNNFELGKTQVVGREPPEPETFSGEEAA